MNNEIKEILNDLGDKEKYIEEFGYQYKRISLYDAFSLLDYITNLQKENKIKDTNWESLKYYLEKLYYKDYIEEAISDDIDKKIKELESKVEIKGYQKDIKTLQQENKRLEEEHNQLINCRKHDLNLISNLKHDKVRYEERIHKTVKYINNNFDKTSVYVSGTDLPYLYIDDLLNILQNGSDDNESISSL